MGKKWVGCLTQQQQGKRVETKEEDQEAAEEEGRGAGGEWEKEET